MSTSFLQSRVEWPLQGAAALRRQAFQVEGSGILTEVDPGACNPWGDRRGASFCVLFACGIAIRQGEVET